MGKNEGAKRLYLIYATILLVYTAQTIPYPVVPLFSEAKGASIIIVGIIVLGNFLSSAILSVPLGILSDKISRKVVVSIGVLMCSISLFLLTLANDPLTILVLYSVTGAGHAAYGPTLMAAVADISPQSALTRSYSMAHASRQIAMALGPMIGGVLGEILGLDKALGFSAVVMVLSLMMVFVFPTRMTEKALEQEVNQSYPESKRSLATWIFATCMVVLGTGIFRAYLPLYANRSDVSLALAGTVFGVQTAFNGGSSILVGRIADSIRRDTSFTVISLALSSLSLVILGYSNTLIGFYISGALIGASHGLGLVIVGVVLARMTNQRNRGMVMGMLTSSVYVGMGVGPAGIGPIISFAGFSTAFLYTALIIMVGMLCFYFLERKTRAIQ